MKRPLLTVAIPTWNRGKYLKRTLAQLHREAAGSDARQFEILVSDNFSSDDTALVVTDAQAAGLEIHFIRNASNIGSDANIAQCFNLARGEYVLILGDDDLLVDGCLAWLMSLLETRRYGIVSLRAYGFEVDFRAEFPGAGGQTTAFSDASDFLVAVNSRMTLISSNVLHKALRPDIDATVFCGGNLVQVHLVLAIALSAPSNMYVNAYKIACKRNNSGGYDFCQVFVQEFGRILDQYQNHGLSAAAVRAIETRMIVGYLPFYLLRERLASSEKLARQTDYLKARFRDRILFWIWLYPIVAFPRPAAIGWGAAATVLGRFLNGDFRRGWRYLIHRVAHPRIGKRNAELKEN